MHKPFCSDLMQKQLLWSLMLIEDFVVSVFFTIAGTKMFPSFTSVLLVTALTSVWAQDLNEERKTNKKSRAKSLAANIQERQGKKMNET